MPKKILNVKENIMICGRKELLERGYDKVTVRNIAEQCHIAVGTLYNYFPSKEILIAYIMLEDWQKEIASLNLRIKEVPTCFDGLREAYCAVRSYADTYRMVWKAYGDPTVSPKRHRMLVGQMQEPIAFLLQKFRHKAKPDPCQFIAEVILHAGCREDATFDDIGAFLVKLL